MSVTTQHKEYSDNLPKWTLVRDCDAGSSAVKAKRAVYLPQPNPDDTSNENKSRFTAYINRANYVNFTAHTKEGMVGMVFRKDTEIKLSTATEYLSDNINGDGLTANQMIKDVTGDTLMTGRYGLLTEYPQAESGLTQAQVTALNLRANIKAYPTESIINWRTMVVGGVVMLSMVVLKEPVEKASDDGFEVEIIDYHRVLLLKEIEGKLTYVQNLYDEHDELIAEIVGIAEDSTPILDADIIPTKSDGSTWNIIPFQFIGSENNDSTVDKAPVYDIAEVNIAHYRNSADNEESSFMVGQPTLAVAGLAQSWVDKNMKDGIGLGSRGGLLLPENGSAELLQADPNQMPEKGMERKEQQIVMIGARLIQDASGNEVVDSVRMRFAGQNSKIGSLVKNVEAAFIQCFMWSNEFMGGTGEPVVDINKELYDASIDPQMIIAQIQLLDRGVIAKGDLQDNLRRTSLIAETRTNKQIDSEAEETVMGGDLGGGE